MRQLLRYMVSFCHKCGNIDEFSLQCYKKETNNYIIKYTCPNCGYLNEIFASQEDIKDCLQNSSKNT